MRTKVLFAARSEAGNVARFTDAPSVSLAPFVGVITRDVRTKLGEAFKKGDVALFAVRAPESSFVDAYSVRNACWTSIPMRALAEIL